MFADSCCGVREKKDTPVCVCVKIHTHLCLCRKFQILCGGPALHEVSAVLVSVLKP